MSKRMNTSLPEFEDAKRMALTPADTSPLSHERQLYQLPDQTGGVSTPDVSAAGLNLNFDLPGIPLNMNNDFYMRVNNGMDFGFSQNSIIAHPQHVLRTSLIPTLGNLSAVILSMLGKPFEEASIIVTNPDSEMGIAFAKVMNMFRTLKEMYSEDSFIYPDAINMKTNAQKTAIRRANLAIFLAAVYGALQIGFFHLNENFLEVFAPDGGKILANQGVLFMELKTQAYISAMAQAERSKEEILNDLFPPDMAQQFLLRRRASLTDKLTYVEKQILEKCAARKDRLANYEPQEDLNEVYPWGKFLSEIACYIHNNHSSISAIPLTPPSSSRRKKKGVRSDVSTGTPQPEDTTSELSDQLTFSVGSSLDGTPEEAQNVSSVSLYEQVRRMVGSSAPRKPTNRRSWTKEEEEALLEGLDQVKGPKWSQILELYGPGGKKSEVLKDRNQVQLKDKARNMKLFFLKNGQMVPPPLQFVTGDLRRD
ncbi:DNA binding factor Trf1 [Schizosaccharomyces japonicus yFS275]|uniref:DNA binding factor Trf1 n=1 Tax=Schizosaccharomyces japonicus (strain yFS275 / FY16936) TaxID=402676 RepID=B6K1V2_SCHJY|nr:DNA binding factor Trf1 [Schizosaccharomyces japonicus yFS275]EEB07133.1 DNA binding factor Trf1 [Schizosaccharomyces japonicus yFS275]